MLEDLSFPPLPVKYWHILGAALLTYSDVCPNTQTTLRGLASSYDLEICTCLLLTSCGSVSLQLFLIYAGQLLHLSYFLWSAQREAKESFDKKERNKQPNSNRL